jgi:hypothetical protein
MGNKKPKTISEYQRWLKEVHDSDVAEIHKNHYEHVASKINYDFAKSKIWRDIKKNLKEFNDEYLLGTGYDLLLSTSMPELDIKSYKSFFLKTFRKNVIENDRWPEEPEEGWYLPSNWYSKINDIVRTCFVTKYLDGVEFTIDKINFLCSQHNLDSIISYEAREEGYYAAHLNILHEFEILKIPFGTEKTFISIELQITTQLQEVIRRLLHKYYEERRKKAREETQKWQWLYKSEEFSANYLGHILHYVEGMIVDIREKQRKKE